MSVKLKRSTGSTKMRVEGGKLCLGRAIKGSASLTVTIGMKKACNALDDRVFPSPDGTPVGHKSIPDRHE